MQGISVFTPVFPALSPLPILSKFLSRIKLRLIQQALCRFFGSIGMGIVSKEFFGLFERISVFSIVVFTFTLGIFGFLQVNTKNSKE